MQHRCVRSERVAAVAHDPDSRIPWPFALQLEGGQAKLKWICSLVQHSYIQIWKERPSRSLGGGKKGAMMHRFEWLMKMENYSSFAYSDSLEFGFVSKFFSFFTTRLETIPPASKIKYVGSRIIFSSFSRLFISYQRLFQDIELAGWEKYVPYWADDSFSSCAVISIYFIVREPPSFAWLPHPFGSFFGCMLKYWLAPATSDGIIINQSYSWVKGYLFLSINNLSLLHQHHESLFTCCWPNRMSLASKPITKKGIPLIQRAVPPLDTLPESTLMTNPSMSDCRTIGRSMRMDNRLTNIISSQNSVADTSQQLPENETVGRKNILCVLPEEKDWIGIYNQAAAYE